MNITNNCQYIKKGPNSITLYGASFATLDGIIKYDCGEGPKVFNGKEFHPTNKEEILDKQVIDLFLLSYTEKDCLKTEKNFLMMIINYAGVKKLSFLLEELLKEPAFHLEQVLSNKH